MFRYAHTKCQIDYLLTYVYSGRYRAFLLGIRGEYTDEEKFNDG